MTSRTVGAFRSDKIRKFLGHIVFNESLNGPRIALNIMNEAKINICFIHFKRGVLSVLCPNSSPYYALILIRTMP